MRVSENGDGHLTGRVKAAFEKATEERSNLARWDMIGAIGVNREGDIVWIQEKSDNPK